MPRKDFNVKKKIREEEESIDEDLKAAGLYEEGLSLIEKRRLVKFIADSKSSAQEEEENRRKFLTIVESTSIDQEITEVEDAQDDFDPVITYESPSTHQNRKQVGNRETNDPKICNSSNNPLFKETAHSSTHSDNTSLSSSNNTEIIKCVKSRLSNSFIKISSLSVHTKTSSDKENLVISESEDETTDPLIIDNNGDKPVNDCDEIKEVFRKSDRDATGIISSEDKEQSVSSNKNNSSFQGSVISNKSDSKPQMGTSDECVPSSIKEVQPQNLEQQLNCISLESPTITPQENSVIINKQSGSKVVDEGFSEDMVLTTKTGFHSDISNARWKRRLVNEKPSQAYFKSPYETDMKCVKRICSLITEWQTIFANHQRSLAHPCKWGPPICVDRKVDGLTKNLNHRPVRNFVSDVIYDSDITESDFHISDQSSEEEWEIFPQKKKRSKSKKQTVWHRKNISKCVSNNVTDLDVNFVKSTTKIKSREETQMREPSAATSSSNLGIEKSFDSQKESFSSDSLWLDSFSKSKNINPQKFYKKSGRKTFQLTPDENQESIDIEESNSCELPDLQSKNSNSEETSQQCISNHHVNSSNLGNLTKNSNGSLNANCDDKRVSVKRKGDSDSHDFPPYKKSASEISKDLSQPNTSGTSCHKDYEGYDSHDISPSIESQESSSKNENKIEESKNREKDDVVEEAS
ncbi:hypothetical protein Avbf_12283 [Armadillidium vulgare]|nr:hypothetical protein Avbf_12283 [Armadillidium vulgare]